ncbi:MAG: lmo0937 family membrane protein [Fimbriimonas sp.]|nr:lmo0937 family membrane protein [Fimbriimonas sp.]
MLELIIIVLVVCWLFGISLHIGGGLIHILLVIALIAIILRLVRGRSTS